MTTSLAVSPRSMRSTGSTPSTAGPHPTRRRDAARVRARSAAVQRAYARRAQRIGALDPDRDSAAATGRTPFVVLVMVLLSATLIATLWLSTAAAADSYRLQSSQEAARELAERSEQLGKDVAALETAPALARRALELGMVPARDPARLVVSPDGAVELVGEPKPATIPPAGPVAPLPGDGQPSQAVVPGGS